MQHFPESDPIDVTGLEQDGELPLILEVLPEKKLDGRIKPALPNDLGGMTEIPFTVTTSKGSYRVAALYFRTNQITAQVVTNRSNYMCVQPSYFFYLLRRTPVPYALTQNEGNNGMTTLVEPGIYRFIAVNDRIARTDGQLEPKPFVLSSKPIKILSYGEQVHFDFQLDQANYIPIDLSQVGTIAEAYKMFRT